MLRTTVIRHVAALALVLFLCSQLHTVLHHHDDLDDHPDCFVCAVAHHQVADSALPLPYVIPTPIISHVIFFFTALLIAFSAPHTYSGRAPPF